MLVFLIYWYNYNVMETISNKGFIMSNLLDVINSKNLSYNQKPLTVEITDKEVRFTGVYTQWVSAFTAEEHEGSTIVLFKVRDNIPNIKPYVSEAHGTTRGIAGWDWEIDKALREHFGL